MHENSIATIFVGRALRFLQTLEMLLILLQCSYPFGIPQEMQNEFFVKNHGLDLKVEVLLHARYTMLEREVLLTPQRYFQALNLSPLELQKQTNVAK